MKILFFSDHFHPEPSAPAAHVYERARIWVSRGVSVTVVTNAPNTPIGRVYDGYRNAWRFVETLDGIRVVRVKTYIAENKGALRRILDYVSYAVSSFVNALFEGKPDVVLSTSPHLFVPLSGVLLALLRRVPHVFEVRDLWPASIAATTGMRRGRLYRALEVLELFLYRRSKRIIVFTPAFQEDLARRGIGRDKMDIVINGANLELFKPRERDAALADELRLRDKFVVGYLGTLGLAHGLENVIHAAKRLANEDFAFLLVGEGADKDKLQRMASDEGLTNVVFVPRQRKEEIPRYWSVCDAGLVHLKNDSVFSTVIPSKIFEAMAVGLPILYVGPPGEGSRIVEQQRVGLTVAPADPEALADAARRLARDATLRSEFARNSVARAPNFSREAQAERTLDSLRRAISDGPPGPVGKL